MDPLGFDHNWSGSRDPRLRTKKGAWSWQLEAWTTKSSWTTNIFGSVKQNVQKYSACFWCIHIGLYVFARLYPQITLITHASDMESSVWHNDTMRPPWDFLAPKGNLKSCSSVQTCSKWQSHQVWVFDPMVCCHCIGLSRGTFVITFLCCDPTQVPTKTN